MICQFCCRSLGVYDNATDGRAFEERKAAHLGKCGKYAEWKAARGLWNWCKT